MSVHPIAFDLRVCGSCGCGLSVGGSCGSVLEGVMKSGIEATRVSQRRKHRRPRDGRPDSCHFSCTWACSRHRKRAYRRFRPSRHLCARYVFVPTCSTGPVSVVTNVQLCNISFGAWRHEFFVPKVLNIRQNQRSGVQKCATFLKIRVPVPKSVKQ